VFLKNPFALRSAQILKSTQTNMLRSCIRYTASLLISGTGIIHFFSGPQHGSFPAIQNFQEREIFTIPRAYLSQSGIRCTEEKLVLYCRDEFGKQMDFLLNEVMNRGSFGWILGSPGTGKSTAAFAFLTSRLDDKAWTFTWMYFASARVQCVKFNNNQREEFVLEYDDGAALRGYLADVADVKKHFIFLDGYVSCGPICGQIRAFTNVCENWLLGNREEHRLCILCSMPSRGKSKMDEDDEKRVKEHLVSSWIVAEYQRAFAQPQVFECFGQNLDAGIEKGCDHDTEESVLSKFFFAGSCARYMFAYKTEPVIRDLETAMESCVDVLPYVTGTIGDQSVLAVNRLISNFVDRENRNSVVRSLVSRFVASQLSLRQGPGMVKRIAKTLRTGMNPALEGFLFEMWFFALIGHEDLLLKPAGTFTMNGLVLFDPSAIIARPKVDRVWYKPLKWNQGGFDAVHVDYSAAAVTFFRVTISKKHSLKLGYFASLIHNLGIQPCSVDILFLVPNDVFENGFKVSNVIGCGLLKDFVNSNKQKWSGRRESGMVQICTFAHDWKLKP
jgi:hypothetical protein